MHKNGTKINDTYITCNLYSQKLMKNCFRQLFPVLKIIHGVAYKSPWILVYFTLNIH